MQQSPEGREQVCDPQGQSRELFELLAGALAMLEHFFNLSDEFCLLVWMKSDDSVVEIESPADPIYQWSEGTLSPTQRNTKNTTKYCQ